MSDLVSEEQVPQEPQTSEPGGEAHPPEAPAPSGSQIVQGSTQEELAALMASVPRNVRRFMGGKMTPGEVWRQLVLRGRPCYGCGSQKGAILIRVFMPLKDLKERNPQLLAEIAAWGAAQGVDSIPTVDFGTPPVPFVRISEKVACDACKATAERAAARGPSWCLVEIKCDPGDINPLVRVARGLKKQ